MFWGKNTMRIAGYSGSKAVAIIWHKNSLHSSTLTALAEAGWWPGM